MGRAHRPSLLPAFSFSSVVLLLLWSTLLLHPQNLWRVSHPRQGVRGWGMGMELLGAWGGLRPEV